MKLYRSTKCGSKQNVIYDIEKEIQNQQDLKELVKYDHVMCKFKDNKRSNANFQSGNVLFANYTSGYHLQAKILSNFICPDL